MASLLSQLGINKKEFTDIQQETVNEGSARDAGVYDAAVDLAYIRKTDSGANMLEVKFKLADDSEFYWSTCVLSGDEKGNKSTWTVREDHAESTKKRYGVGTEVPLPGVVEMRHFLDAIGEEDPAAAQGEVKHKDDTITALCLTGVQGKRLKLGLNQEESLYNDEISVRNSVKYWMDGEGKNKEGDIILEKVVAKLEKNPLKKLKVAGGAGNAPAAANTATAAASGW